MDMEVPKTLGEAIGTEPQWLRTWVRILVATHLAAVFFLVERRERRFRIRPEPLAILVAFVAAGVAMGRLYEEIGYVRLLGSAHLVFWGPVFVWILRTRRRLHPVRSPFGFYLHAYLLIAGISLLIDASDVIRHLLGDGQLSDRQPDVSVALRPNSSSV